MKIEVLIIVEPHNLYRVDWVEEKVQRQVVKEVEQVELQQVRIFYSWFHQFNMIDNFVTFWFLTELTRFDSEWNF